MRSMLRQTAEILKDMTTADLHSKLLRSLKREGQRDGIERRGGKASVARIEEVIAAGRVLIDIELISDGEGA